MNVANIEVCRELYDLSEWGKNTKGNALELWGTDSNNQSAIITSNEYASGESKIGIPIILLPAYDLGYLLRKLPYKTEDGWLSLFKSGENNWMACYIQDEDQFNEEAADTPENAAAALAVQLFCKGVLKK